MVTIRLAIVLALLSPVAHSAPPEVETMPTPNSGIQAVAEVDAMGNVHLIYFHGEAAHGDIFHAVRPAGAGKFSDAVRGQLDRWERPRDRCHPWGSTCHR